MHLSRFPRLHLPTPSNQCIGCPENWDVKSG